MLIFGFSQHLPSSGRGRKGPMTDELRHGRGRAPRQAMDPGSFPQGPLFILDRCSPSLWRRLPLKNKNLTGVSNLQPVVHRPYAARDG